MRRPASASFASSIARSTRSVHPRSATLVRTYIAASTTPHARLQPSAAKSSSRISCSPALATLTVPVKVIAGCRARGCAPQRTAGASTSKPWRPEVCARNCPGRTAPVAASPATRSASASSGTVSRTRSAPPIDESRLPTFPVPEKSISRAPSRSTRSALSSSSRIATTRAPIADAIRTARCPRPPIPATATVTETRTSSHSTPSVSPCAPCSETAAAPWATPLPRGRITGSRNLSIRLRPERPKSWPGKPTKPPMVERTPRTISGSVMVRGDSCRWCSFSAPPR